VPLPPPPPVGPTEPSAAFEGPSPPPYTNHIAGVTLLSPVSMFLVRDESLTHRQML
jgi:hypothetical protein